uniref:Uncharacterized protein n=1 Tax=Sarcocystis aucheniae TaxID=65407 RepID=A0A5P9S4R5_9APIC|nr:hypothetical protein [Sarcocystis aucheniae]
MSVKSTGMAVSNLSVIVTVVLALLAPPRLAAGAKQPITLTCPETGGVQKAQVVEAGTTVKVVCVASATFTPAASSNSVTNVFIGPNCDAEQLLATVCPNATGTKDDTTVTFNIQNLPAASRQFCIACKKDQNPSCTAEVYLKVPAAQGSPPVCETPGGSITLDLPAAEDHVSFSCAYGLHLTPTTATRVFADDCTEEEDLPVMKLAKDDSVYTVTAIKKPPKKKLCYLCGPENVTMTQENKSKFCAVYIQAGDGARTLFHVGLSLTLPCLLAALHFT